MEAVYGLRWLPHDLAGWLSRVLIGVATLSYYLRLLPRLYEDNKNVILILIINDWDLSLILVIRLQ